MQPKDVISIIQSSYSDIIFKESFGEYAFFYNKNCELKNGVYFFTIKTKDGANDFLSQLSKANSFRINFKLSKQRYCNLFEKLPSRFDKLLNFDLTKRNILLPHPVYAWMSWACIIDPALEYFNANLFLIDESYKMAKINFEKRIKLPIK